MRFNPFVPHGPEPFTPTPKSGGPVLSTIEFFKKKIDELFRKDSTSVHYTREDKADEEKTVARDNIGAQEKLVSGVNLKTVRGQSLLGSGDVPQVPAEWGGIMGNLGMQTDLVEALGGKADRSETYTKTETDTAIVANVEDSVTSTSTTKALSANMGKELQDQIQNLKHSKADEVKPSFSTITINGVDYTEWTLGTRSGKIMLSVDMGGISTEIAAFNPVTGVFESAPSQYRDTLRFDGEAPVVGASPTLFDHVARESALSGKADISHTHTKSEITDFPTSMPPTAHSHASDGWFTTALEAVKVWAKALLPNWLTPDYVEPATVASVETKVNRSGDTMTGKLIVSAGTDGDTGFRAQINASNWAELKASKIHVKRGSASVTRVFSFPDTSGIFAIREDLNTSIAPAFIANHLYKAGDRIVNDGTLYKARADFTSGAAFRSADWDTDNVVNALEAVKVWANGAFAAITHSHASDSWFTTALGRKLDVDGPTVESGMTVKGSIYSTGLYTRYDEGSTSTKYAPEHIENGEAVILLPSSSGTFALTSDIAEHNESSSAHSDIRTELANKVGKELSGQTFDISVDAQFKNMCIAMARALGAVVTHTTDDTSTGGQVAQAYGITPTDATTFGELQTKAGLGDSAVLGDL